MPKQVQSKYLSTVHSNSARGEAQYGNFVDYGLMILNTGLKLRKKCLHITVTSASDMALEQPC